MKYLKQEEDGMLKQTEITERQGSPCEDDGESKLGKQAVPGSVTGFCGIYWSSLIAQLVKNLPAGQETWVRSLGREDPLEKEKAAYTSILA